MKSRIGWIIRHGFALRSASALLLATLLLAGLGLPPASSAGAQQPAPEASPVAPQQPAPRAEPDASKPSSLPRRLASAPITPRGAIRAFVEAARANRFQAAARLLDLSGLPDGERQARGAELARQLWIVLTRAMRLDPSQFSDRPEGDPADGEGVELVTTLETPEGTVDVLLERVTDPQGLQVWKFSSETLKALPELYQTYGYGSLIDRLPPVLFDVELFGVFLWQWIGLLLGLLAALVVSWIGVALLYRSLAPLAARTRTSFDDELLRAGAQPLRYTVALVLFRLAILPLKLPAGLDAFLSGTLRAAAIVVITWLMLRIVDGLTAKIRARLEDEGRTAVLAVLPLGVRTLKVALIVLAVIGSLQNLGFNVTGLLAGLGVGGLALALAAQKTIENLFGGVSLVLDQTVKVGDFCKFGDKVGTVEEIGIRSTKIRTLDRTVITVPNADFSQTQIENFTRRDRIRLYGVLGLRYETTPDQMRFVLAELRKLLVAHPCVVNDAPWRVRFVNFGAYSLDLEIYAYIQTQDYNEFLAVREDIYLRIMDVVDAAGTGFAFPSQTTYFARDGGLDDERARQAERTVEQWRKEGRLPFPDLPPEELAELDDHLDYPPRGSALVRRAEGSDDPGSGG